MRDARHRPEWWILLFLFSLGIMTVATFLARPQQPVSQPEKTASPNEYAGSEACASCHEDLYQRFQKNPHQLLETHPKKGWQKKSCEACHGPGAVHVETGDAAKVIGFFRSTSQEITTRCLNCHARMDEHAGFLSGAHGRNQVACTDCHNIHEPRQTVHLWAVKSDQLCVRCHRDNLVSFNKPYRHRFQEGAIHCVDCHQPHGGLNPRQVRLANGNEPACAKCHIEVRGPFVYEHPPMRIEGCNACHEPHGSNNAKLLTRNKVAQLCLECHSTSTGALASQPPSFHDLRSPRYQNCTTCHLRIHGSNASPQFLR